MNPVHQPTESPSGAHHSKNLANESTVVLTGATSQLGVFLIPRLLRAGYRVVAISRKAGQIAERSENLYWVEPGVLLGTEPPNCLPVEAGPTLMMISCGPLELTVNIISKWNRTRRLVVFSTTSVFSKADSEDPQEREQIAGILQQENILKVLCHKLATELVILRPTMIYGCGLDRNISRLAHWIKRFGWLPVAGDARGLRQPVHADDLAQLAVSALVFEGEIDLDSPACGGSTLSYRQVVELIFDSQDRTRRVIGLPPVFLSFCLAILKWLGLSPGTNREMVRRQNVDLVFDDSAVKALLDYSPRPFRPTPKDFQLPV